ncbi:MAG: hypothetical protein IPK83_12730 [Planctomycetes bacterium]|nr:hypothetical protein [Planctomycetota bacterium]
MREFMCRRCTIEQDLKLIPPDLKYTIIFRFAFIPAEHFGQPDEGQHLVSKDIRVALTKRGFDRLGKLATGTQDQRKMLFWYARETLERDEDSLNGVDAEYLNTHDVDVSKVDFPISKPFQFSRRQPMRFHT